MDKKNILKEKSYAFALTVIQAFRGIVNVKKEYILSKQLIRAGTAIGALVREAEFAQSKADFISKLSIALKESNETDYWISLLRDSAILETDLASQLDKDNKELVSLLVASIKTAKGL